MSEAQKKEPAAAPAAAKASAPAPQKTDVLGLVTAFLVLTNLAVIGGLGYSLQKVWDRVQDLQSRTQRMEASQTKKESPVGRELQATPPGTPYPLESFLVNIPSDQGARFLQTQMELELGDPAAEEEITRKKAAIRDAVIVMLSSRSFKELNDAAGMKRLRTDLLRTINNLLSGPKVKGIYFTQFHFN